MPTTSCHTRTFLHPVHASPNQRRSPSHHPRPPTAHANAWPSSHPPPATPPPCMRAVWGAHRRQEQQATDSRRSHRGQGERECGLEAEEWGLRTGCVNDSSALLPQSCHGDAGGSLPRSGADLAQEWVLTSHTAPRLPTLIPSVASSGSRWDGGGGHQHWTGRSVQRMRGDLPRPDIPRGGCAPHPCAPWDVALLVEAMCGPCGCSIAILLGAGYANDAAESPRTYMWRLPHPPSRRSCSAGRQDRCAGDPDL